jgi:hypothetical protein
MPSITHEGPIEIIRQHPKLTTELVRHATGIEIPGDDEVEVTLGSTDDLERIDQWLDLALTATSAGDVFKD